MFGLNDSTAAQELDVSDAPEVNGEVGTLAYYAPWGDVVMFYGDFARQAVCMN